MINTYKLNIISGGFASLASLIVNSIILFEYLKDEISNDIRKRKFQ